MFKHILVPTDLTDRSLKALEIAIKMALHEGCPITLLHVIETIDDTDEDFSEFYDKLGRAAEKRMNRIISESLQNRLTIAKEIIYGKRVREIIRFAGERQIDLIVLSSHRVDVDNVVQGWGTISYKVGILSPCPVLLVK
jgi:nucleotide-binding universal stress UspA family protein